MKTVIRWIFDHSEVEDILLKMFESKIPFHFLKACFLDADTHRGNFSSTLQTISVKRSIKVAGQMIK